MNMGDHRHRQGDSVHRVDGDAGPNGSEPSGFSGAAWEAGWRPPRPEVLAEAESILNERARQYAQAPPEARAGTWTEILLFRIGEEQYAAELRLLRSVHHADGLAPIPCTPAHVAGILNVRGEVIPVLDLAVMLGLGAASERKPGSQVVMAELPQGRIGLLVDEVLGADRLALDRLSHPLSGREFVRGVADAQIVVLDLEQFVSGGQFEVFEDVS